jgi:hypothetical protein
MNLLCYFRPFLMLWIVVVNLPPFAFCDESTNSGSGTSEAEAEFALVYGKLPPFILTPLARQIVGTWQGSRHTDTYLADGRFGLDIEKPADCVGYWRLKGKDLIIYFSGSVATGSNVSVTKTELTFYDQGRKFVYQRVENGGGHN